MCCQILALELVPLSYECVSGKRRFFTLCLIFVIDVFYGPQGPTRVIHFSANGISFPPTSAGDTQLLSVQEQRLTFKIDRTLSQSILTNLLKSHFLKFDREDE